MFHSINLYGNDGDNGNNRIDEYLLASLMDDEDENDEKSLKTQVSSIAGYDPSIFISSQESSKYLCTICQHVCQNAMDIGCGNQHIFCSNCIRIYFKYNNNEIIHKCPSCQLKVTQSTTYKLPFVDRLVSQLKVKCPNKITAKQLSDLQISDRSMRNNDNNEDLKEDSHEFWKMSMECRWKGELGDIEYHYKHSCKYHIIECELCLKNNASYKSSRGLMKYHIINCPFVSTMCINGCSQLIMKKDLQTHIDTVCPQTLIKCINSERGCDEKIRRKKLHFHRKICQYELVICQYCKSSQNMIVRMDLIDHYEKCPLFLIQCPNKGCSQRIQRQNLQSHLLTDCEEEIISCPIDQRCKIKLKRKQLNNHKDIECDFVLVHCVYCDQDILRKDFANHTNRECDLIPIQCPLKCGKMIEKKNIKIHKEQNCEEFLIKCDNDLCQEIMKRKYLTEHYLNKCPYSLIICKYCDKTEALRMDMDKHYEQCMFFKLKCPQNCDKMVMRRDLKYHIENECDEIILKCSNNGCSLTLKKREFDQHVYQKCCQRIIQCKYRKYGCHHQCKAKELIKHLQETELLHVKLETKYEINEIRSEMNKIIQTQQQQNVILKQEVLSLKRKLNEEMTSKWIVVFESKYRRDISHIKCVDIKHKKYEQLTTIDSDHIWKWNSDSCYFITKPLPPCYFVAYNNRYNHHGDDIDDGDQDIGSRKDIGSRVIYRIGGCDCDNVENIGYRLDKCESWKLPQLTTKRWAHKIVYSKYHGLLCVGGTKYGKRASLTTCLNSIEQLTITNTLNDFEYYDDDDDNKSISIDNKWRYLLPMNNRRHNPSACLITDHPWMSEPENLMVCGGWYDNDDLRSSELYSFTKNEWVPLSDMLSKHQSGGICQWKLKNSNIVMVGGWGEFSRKKAEEYNPERNKWYSLPDTRYNHRFNPCLSIYGGDTIPSTFGILIVIGDYPCTANINDWGNAEFYDPRCKDWQVIDSVANLCGYNNYWIQQSMNNNPLMPLDVNDIKRSVPTSHTILPPIF